MNMREVKIRRAARRNALSASMIGFGVVVMLAGGSFGWRFFGACLLAAGILCQKKGESLRIQALTDYLEQANAGNAAVLSALGEDGYSKLEDEIYKTVTYLYQTREEAVRAKNEFAQNLSNIAHQIKTPITAISLCIQTMGGEAGMEGREQMHRQLVRLTHLEEALLVLARLDAGTLVLKREETDVYTLLMLAADNLQEIFAQAEVSVDIPELGETTVKVDLDWTMEAVMNLMKNCAEHNTGGCVHCSYGQNPLYTEILIWDEGAGFDRKEIPHLFERFYRGKNAGGGGIGIGLALAKEMVERQNGTIRAKNLPEGGACFTLRFYCH
ncbi:MAG: HAMP domain-containing histidine kinase [Lachnospiraceae bacterium]|nr:HAMP domain-containing histidine kinase [Lachnospiraceae bacterium]